MSCRAPSSCWGVDAEGRSLLALLAALARDPFLASTLPAVVLLPAGAELQREPMKPMAARQNTIASGVTDPVVTVTPDDLSGRAAPPRNRAEKLCPDPRTSVV